MIERLALLAASILVSACAQTTRQLPTPVPVEQQKVLRDPSLGNAGTTYQVGTSEEQARAEAERTHASRDPLVPATLKLDAPPRVISSRFPDYPQRLINQERVGSVTVTFNIEIDGSVTGAAVVGSPPAELAKITVDAIREWKFEPARRNGLPVQVRAQQTFAFRVK